MGIPRGSHRWANQRGPEESSAGLRTRRDARYNRAVVPWWRRDLNPGGSHRGGLLNAKFSPRAGARVTTRCTSESRKFVRSERRLERSRRRRIEREVWREAGEQYARVPWFALNGVFRPRGLRLFPCLSPPIAPFIFSIILTIAAFTTPCLLYATFPYLWFGGNPHLVVLFA